MNDIPPSTRVLVAVITRPHDLEQARRAGWYRVPLERAPRGLAADYLAFYQTAAFGAERWSVRWLAELRQVTLATRRDLLPDEPGHPRADARYFRLALGPLRALPAPLPSRRLRRITFIPTTYGQLVAARDVAELWRPAVRDDMGDLWAAGLNRR